MEKHKALTLIRVVTLCGLTCRYQCLRDKYCLDLQHGVPTQDIITIIIAAGTSNLTHKTKLSQKNEQIQKIPRVSLTEISLLVIIRCLFCGSYETY